MEHCTECDVFLTHKYRTFQTTKTPKKIGPYIDHLIDFITFWTGYSPYFNSSLCQKKKKKNKPKKHTK